MPVTVYSSKILRKGLTQAEINSLSSKFKEYKTTKDPKDYFGRDVSFNRPHSVAVSGLMHVHLNEPKQWGVRAIRLQNGLSNTHLVYCSGYRDENCYLMITLLTGNAHEKYQDTLYLLGLAEHAEKFREKF